MLPEIVVAAVLGVLVASFACVYLVTQFFDLSASCGSVSLVFLGWRAAEPIVWVG